MKQSIYNAILALALVSAVLPSAGQETKYVTAPTDAEYNSLLKEYTLNADGSMDYRYAKEQKLLNYRAFHNLYGETFVVYDPAFMKLKVNTCFTVMADGKKTEAPANAFNEVLPGFAANAPAFNALREMVITHTGLERGAVIHLDYTLHTDKGNFPALMGTEVLAENEPVKELILRVKVAGGGKLYYKLGGGAAEPVKTSENGFAVYTWKLQNIAPISTEELQRAYGEAYPKVSFSTSGERNKAFEYLTNQPAFALKISPAMKAEVDALAKDNPDKLALALKIQEKVINDIRLWPVPLKYAGYRLRTPETVWMTMGATPAEKAVLMAAMLEAAGIEADPVAIVRESLFDEKVGTLADIEDFAVITGIKDLGPQYLSINVPNSQSLHRTIPSRVFAALGQGEKPEYAKSDAGYKMQVSGSFTINAEQKLNGEISLDLRGASDPYLGLIRDKNKMKGMISGSVSKASLKEMKVSQSSSEASFQTWSVSEDKPLKKDSSWAKFVIPVSNAGVESWNIKTLSSKRSQDLEIPWTGEEAYEYSLELPSGMSLFTPAGKTEISNKAGKFYFELKQEGSKVIIVKKIKFDSRIVIPANYAGFKELMDGWNEISKREIVLKVSG